MNELEEFEFRRRFELEQAGKATPKQPKTPTLLSEALGSIPAQFGFGAARGIGGIGATLTGQGDEGRKALERGLVGYGANPESLAYGAGKLGSEIGATLPIGGALARLVGGGAGALPTALRTAGMSTGAAPLTMAGKSGDLALRTGAAGAVGATSAAAIDPNEALQAGGISALMPSGFKAVGAVGSAAGSMLKPFGAFGGQEGMVGDMLRKFSANPKEALRNIKSASPIIEGSTPNTIAASGDVGLAGLGRTLQSTSPQYANELAALQTAQNQARTKAFEDIAGNQGKVSLAKEARDLETKPMRDYVLSNAAPIDTNMMLSGIDKLMKDPDNAGKITRAALADVRKSIERIGESGQINPRALYAIRKDVGLDISGKVQGESSNAKFASSQLMDVKSMIDEAIDKASRQPVSSNMIASNAGNLAPRPSWKQYLDTYTEKSKPINQMETLGDVLKRVQTGTVDSQGGYVLSSAKLNNILKNEGADLSKKLTPEQLDIVRKLSADLNASQLASSAGKAVGSNTVQNIAGNNILSSLLGEKMGGSVMSKSLMGRLLKLPYGTADEMIREKLGEALLNPQVAAKYMQQQQTNKLGGLLQELLPYTYRATPAIAAQ